MDTITVIVQLVTVGLLIWYSLETRGMRVEAAKQTELQTRQHQESVDQTRLMLDQIESGTRPVLVVSSFEPAVPVMRASPLVKVINAGKGVALEVETRVHLWNVSRDIAPSTFCLPDRVPALLPDSEHTVPIQEAESEQIAQYLWGTPQAHGRAFWIVELNYVSSGNQSYSSVFMLRSNAVQNGGVFIGNKAQVVQQLEAALNKFIPRPQS